MTSDVPSREEFPRRNRSGVQWGEQRFGDEDHLRDHVTASPEPKRPAAKAPDPLRILAVFYTIAAVGMALLGTSALVIIVIGIRGVVSAAGRRNADMDIGAFLIVHGALAVLIGWFCALVLFRVGRNLAERRNYWVCFLLGCYFCLAMPILGIPTIVLLTRPGVKTTFAVPRKDRPFSLF